MFAIENFFRFSRMITYVPDISNGIPLTLLYGYNGFMQDHYVCRGTCGGVSEEPGVCQAEHCPRYHAPLERCACADGRHEASTPPQGRTGESETF